MTLDALLSSLFELDRKALGVEAAFFGTGDDSDRAEALTLGIRSALRVPGQAEASLRLKRLADLCAQVPRPAMADGLIEILNHSEHSVRLEAGQALLDVGYDRYADVARAIERALDKGTASQALAELPWVLAEISEPSALPLIRRFLTHSDPNVVASAIESLAELGDPEAATELCALVGDARAVEIDDSGRCTIGELAEDAIDALTRDE